MDLKTAPNQDSQTNSAAKGLAGDAEYSSGVVHSAESHDTHSGHANDAASHESHFGGHADVETHASVNVRRRNRDSKKPQQARESISPRNFLWLLFAFVCLVIFVVVGPGFFFDNLFWTVLVLILLFLIWRYDFILQLKEYERAVVYTFGRASGVVGPGWAVLFPPIQSYTKVDLRTKVIDIKPQKVVTSDGVEVTIDALLFLKVNKDKDSVLKSVVEVENYQEAARSYIHAVLRDVIGSIPLTELISNIENMSARLQASLEKIAAKWGVGVESVKIQEVKIPDIVLNSMHEEKAATQQKLASFQKAEAHEREISAVKTATGDLTDKTLTYYYVKALEEIGKSGSTKFVLPLEVTRLIEKFSAKENTNALEDALKKYEPQIRALLEKENSLPKKKKNK